MKTRKSSANTARRQRWPFIKTRTYPGGRSVWLVDARTKEGGDRKSFDALNKAEDFAEQCRARRQSEGNSAFGNLELARYGKTVQHAIDFYLTHLRQQARSISLPAALAELVDVRRKAGKSHQYCRDLELRIGRFVAAFEARTVASFTAKELDEWLAGLAVAPGTRNTFRRDLRTLFSFCEKRGYCATNEAKKTERARVVDKPVEILTIAQAAALLTASGDDVLPVLAIGLFAGLRSAELGKLDWQQVDFESGHIEVTAANSKTARRRLVPISENLAAWLRPVAALVGPVAPVGLRKRFEAVRARAGFAAWPQNALRHSFGSYRLAQCHDAARVSLEMGNSPAMVFAHYRELVKPKDAARFWQLSPAQTENVVAMA